MGSPEKPIDVEMGDMNQDETDKLAPDVDIKSGEKTDEPEKDRFTGLKKDELLEISSQKQWVIARWVLFIVFWVGWVGMLVGAIIIVVKAPRCRPDPTPEWYQDTVVYQADIQKFAGGDIDEMKEHLDYVRSLNARTLTVSNINNPDDLEKVIDNKTAQFAALVASSHDIEDEEKDMKIVVDLRIDVLKTSSPQFVKSATKGCTDFCALFMWKDNASLALDSTGEWVYHETREESYKASKDDEGLAYVNYASQDALDYISTVVKMWIGHGADGFQLGDMAQINGAATVVETLQTAFNETQSDVEEENRKVIGLFLVSSDVAKQRTLFPDDKNSTDSAATVINTAMAAIATGSGAGQALQIVIENWHNNTFPFIGANAMNTMSLDLLAKRHTPEQAAGLTILSQTLPGVPVIRSGDEALLSDDIIAWNNTVADKKSQLPNNASSGYIGVFSEMADLRVNQHRALRSLRYDYKGAFLFRVTNSTDVLAFTRKWDSKPAILVVSNPSDKEVTVKIVPKENESIEKIILASDPTIDLKNAEYSLNGISLKSGLTLVLELKSD